MSRYLVTINSNADRERAHRFVQAAPFGTRVELKATKRTLDQNSKLWASLTDVAEQKDHCGRKYTADQWKILFLHACGREVQLIPSLDNSTFLPWGQSSSDLSKSEMGELIDFIIAWGTQNGVVFHDPSIVSHSSLAHDGEDVAGAALVPQPPEQAAPVHHKERA